MELTRVEDVAVLRMRAGKANAIGRAFLETMSELVHALRASDASAAVITGDGRFFSAGLALPELVRLEREAMREVITSFERVMESLHALPLPVIAAVDGHAVAGGCVLALQCDRRVMARGRGRIGLSEIALGIGLPPSAIEGLRAAVPSAALAPIALEGRLLEADDARALGLVDEVVDADALMDRALSLARALGANGRPGYAQIKAALRGPALERMRAARADELERWLDTFFDPFARERLRAVVEKLAPSA